MKTVPKPLVRSNTSPDVPPTPPLAYNPMNLQCPQPAAAATCTHLQQLVQHYPQRPPVPCAAVVPVLEGGGRHGPRGASHLARAHALQLRQAKVHQLHATAVVHQEVGQLDVCWGSVGVG